MRVVRFIRALWSLGLVLCASGVMLFSSTLVVACDDPSLHPEMKEMLDVIESMRSEVRSPVEIRYKIAGDRQPGEPLSVVIAFWPTESYANGSFTVAPSSGLELVGFGGGAEIPYKGSVEFTIRPMRSGYHYLKVDTVVNRGEEQIKRGVAIAVPVVAQHSPIEMPSPTGDSESVILERVHASSPKHEGGRDRKPSAQQGALRPEG